MAGNEIVYENLRRTHVTEGEITTRLRMAGICNRDEVACMIFESTGSISVLRSGVPIEPEILQGVTGAELIPKSFLAASQD